MVGSVVSLRAGPSSRPRTRLVASGPEISSAPGNPKFDLREETRRFLGQAIAAVIGSNRKNFSPTPCPFWAVYDWPPQHAYLGGGIFGSHDPCLPFLHLPRRVRCLNCSVAQSVGVDGYMGCLGVCVCVCVFARPTASAGVVTQSSHRYAIS